MSDLSGEIDKVTERTRRRFIRRQWRRRWLRAKPILIGLALATVLIGGVWLIWFSSVLGVKSVTVHGADALKVSEIETAAAIENGVPLANVDLGKIADRVGALAPVQGVEITRQWPNEIRIAVTERTPIAVIDIGGKLRGLDKDGVVFLNYKKAPAGLPRVVTPAGTEARALREAAAVVEALPANLARITRHVEVKSMDHITLAMTKGRTVEWGGAADSDQKAAVLTALMKQKATEYDVSVPGQPTTR